MHIGDIVICRKWIAQDFGCWGGQWFEISPIDAYYPKADREIDMTDFTAPSGETPNGAQEVPDRF